MRVDSFMEDIRRAKSLKAGDEKLTVRRGMIVTIKKNMVERAIEKLKEVFNGR